MNTSDLPHLSERDIQRYWAKVQKAGSDDCWLWTGWKNKEGYGRFDVGRLKPLATRLALALDGRPPPSLGALALHGDCSNPACCNPRHLRWGWGDENAADRERLGRRTVVRGERHKLAKLCPEDVLWIRASDAPHKDLAELYGVSKVLISRIKLRKTWKHLP